MFNKCIVNKIREIIPTYRYNSLKEFYSKCSLIHTRIADEAIDTATKTGEEEMGKITGGLNIPGMPGMF